MENKEEKKNVSAYEQQKKKKLILAIVAAVVVVAVAVVVIVGAISKKNNEQIVVSVGSKAFTEQQILGNILSDVIETNDKYTVDRKIGLGGTSIVYEALQQGSIDMYVEYSAGCYLNHLALDFKPLTGDEIIETITPLLAEKGVVVGPRLGFSNDYELTVTREYAEEHNLKTIWDLKDIEDDIVVAPTFEYVNRADGMLGINDIYGIYFKNVVPMEAGLRYTALNTGEADVINTFTTDGMKYKLDLVALEDPENVHMYQEAIILYNKDSYEAYPDLAETLSVLDGLITGEDMVYMNYLVDVEGKTPEEVAIDFLTEKGIVKQ